MTEQNPEASAPQVAPEAPAEQPTPTAAQQASPESLEDSNVPEEQEREWDPERAKEKIRKINSENRTLRERASQAEQRAETVPELQTQNATLGSENLRLRVGYELGLPLDLATRLQGSTREELVTDAERLVALIAPNKPAAPMGMPVASLRPGATPSGVTSEDEEFARFYPTS